MNEPYNRVDRPRTHRRLAAYGMLGLMGGGAAFAGYRANNALRYYNDLGRAMYGRGAAAGTIARRVGGTALNDLAGFATYLGGSKSFGGLARRFFRG